MQFLFDGTNHEDLQKRHIVQIKDFSGGIGCHNM